MHIGHVTFGIVPLSVCAVSYYHSMSVYSIHSTNVFLTIFNLSSFLTLYVTNRGLLYKFMHLSVYIFYVIALLLITI